MTAESTKGKRKIFRRLCFVVISGILVVTVILICYHWNSPSIDEQLAAIEAARAIPDSENAAILYCELLENNDATSFDYHPEFLDKDSANVTLIQPWSAKDYPELAAWISEHWWLIDSLLQASQFENCRFPISIEPYRLTQMDRPIAMRKWAFLLKRAANNDVAEGRIDEAIAKWQCLIQMGRHIYEQPTILDQSIGIFLETQAMTQIRRFLVEDDVSENQLQRIESFPLATQDEWTAIMDRIQPVEELAEQKLIGQFSPLGNLWLCLFRWKMRGTMESPSDFARSVYLKHLSATRGIKIMIALRRYKNSTNRWPTSIDEIRSSVSEEILKDPLNDGEFKYKLSDETFTLYSKGENGKDDGGRRSTASGSKSKLPKGAEDDILFWPVRRTTKSEDTR